MMKRLLLIAALVLALTACGQTQITPPPTGGGQTVRPPVEDQATQTPTPDRAPTAAELGREETTRLAMSVEGATEEVPATLRIRQGYSIYIPDEGWQFDSDVYEDGAIWEDQWESVHNDDVELAVRCYAEMTAADARECFLRDEDDYVFEDLLGGELGKTPLTGTDLEDGEKLAFVTAEKDGNTYVVYWKHPVEATEGFGTRLPIMAETFQLHP